MSYSKSLTTLTVLKAQGNCTCTNKHTNSKEKREDKDLTCQFQPIQSKDINSICKGNQTFDVFTSKNYSTITTKLQPFLILELRKMTQ